MERNWPYDESDIGQTALFPQYRADLRSPHPTELNAFIQDNIVKDWSSLTWKQVGKPFRVVNYAEGKRRWEEKNGDTLPVQKSWELFNQSFHTLFMKDVPTERKRVMTALLKNVSQLHWKRAARVLGELEELTLWNTAHRIQDAIWDPRGKRALFQGLDIDKPRVLFLGAADGYEAMQLYAMYPGGEVVLVDYDDFCRTDRFGKFPEQYPFLGVDPNTGSHKVWYKDQMNISFITDDIRNLPFGREFDIVVSVGLIEHFPDEHKAEAIDFHRRFLKPDGYAILTTPRLQWKSRLFYHVLAEWMNYTYRELMTVQQMGLYLYESGFEILRHGTIKAHNGIVARIR
ncbi:bifunctional 2-polyprenyl-6-hydroxyphenol methylase/3-demethylubiquinol 3-O-methyltransferase UbiG [Alicyclobacillus sp. SP_1]|uniref:class I SAM-dependent methyltransferase n=1 Tax=Alicyclobacillus sp. SP_1 TaxID=2942475 RepID=UPI0021580EC4|nr:class I SAM-dependent methyltransferase [Alicyclobacillus sp. SP_1]